MEIRDIVRPINGFILHSGSSQYDYAIVASLVPFILISEEGDMMWSSTVKQVNFVSNGRASKNIWKNVQKRMKIERSNMVFGGGKEIEIMDKKNIVSKLPKFISKIFTKQYSHQGFVYIVDNRPVYLARSFNTKWLEKVYVRSTSYKRAERLIFEFLDKKYPQYGPFIRLF